MLTYSLTTGNTSSNDYYQDISAFCDKVLEKMQPFFFETVHQYSNYLEKEKGENNSTEETYLELLTLGTLWRIYSYQALHTKKIPQKFLIKLCDIRRDNKVIKTGIYTLKGILISLFFMSNRYDFLSNKVPNLRTLDAFINWLNATDEFHKEVKRLKQWHNFFQKLPTDKVEKILIQLVSFSKWFEKESIKVLGTYTEGVDKYLERNSNGRFLREDTFFCNRKRMEYHLNMVGAEFMNRGFRTKFCKTSQKLLLLPTCMAKRGPAKCLAKRKDDWYKCSQCTKGCQVNTLVVLGKKMNFKVLMVAHGSSIAARKNNTLPFNSNTGIVGVSCVLNLISGGWLLKDMGIPAQCVILEQCGCKNHWDKKGITTKLNINYLKKIMCS